MVSYALHPELTLNLFNLVVYVLFQVDSIQDMVSETLQKMSKGSVDDVSEDQLKDFKKRRLINNE